MAATFAPFIATRQGRKMMADHGVWSALPRSPESADYLGAEAYSASKAAAIAYLESLRLEMRACGIAVVTIAPGYIATPMV